MRMLLKLGLWTALFAVGGVVLIKVLYDVSWDDAVEIADEFVCDLLA